MSLSIPSPARAYRRAFSAKPHFLDSTGTMAVWFTEPQGVVLQFVEDGWGNAANVRWLADEPLAELKRRLGDEPLVVVVDLSRMLGRDRSGRAAFIELSKSFAGRVKACYVVPPMSATPMYLATLKTTASILKVFGLHFEFAETASDAIAALGMQAAP